MLMQQDVIKNQPHIARYTHNFLYNINLLNQKLFAKIVFIAQKLSLNITL